MPAIKKKTPPGPPATESQAVFNPGRNPERNAWYTSFFIENHLDHFTYPDQAASPEQVRFMVYTEDEARYYPCSDRMFNAIMERKPSGLLNQKYQEVLQRVLNLIETHIDDGHEKSYLKALTTIKFQHETRDGIMLPSRLEKRLIKIFLNRTQIEDPYLCEKASRNWRVQAFLTSREFQSALNQVDIRGLVGDAKTLGQIKARVEQVELRRLISLMAVKPLWESEPLDATRRRAFQAMSKLPITGGGGEALFDFLGISGRQESGAGAFSKKILWLADEAGEFLIDLAVIKYLTRLGHKVMIGLKEGPLFTKVDFYDIQADDILKSELEGAFLIKDPELSKNDLLKILRNDFHMYFVSDSTRENLNLILASTTFARIFKEVDGIISRGDDQKRRLFETHFQFTTDIFNITATDDDQVLISFKPRHPQAIKFSHKDLEKKAKAIINQMAEAKKQGMTVVFYSGIIGSIPGKIQIAKKVMSVFINYLKEQFEKTYIINPSEYYEPGMDADDLMYMWEIVQRSGMIDIWRFQTYNDIARAFHIMETKVPPEWVGKDATYSTGCTKEMRIAQEVQKQHPEMQIIGPAKEMFGRRLEYGVGKMYDQRLSEICQIN